MNRLLFLLLICCPKLVFAQEDFTVTGRAYDEHYPGLMLEHLMIINQHAHNGIFANADNSFSIKASRNDTILVAASGYEAQRICFHDSVPRNRYTLTLALKKLSVELKGVTIDRKRSLPQIEEEINKLGYNPNDYRIHGSEAWMSPISALYSAFSKKEKAKRQVAEWMNRDNRNDLLKELFRYYQRAGLMNLPQEHYDDFIRFLAITDEQLQAFSQYDLAVYIRSKYFQFGGK